jgi:hypothetical protein
VGIGKSKQLKICRLFIFFLHSTIIFRLKKTGSKNCGINNGIQCLISCLKNITKYGVVELCTRKVEFLGREQQSEFRSNFYLSKTVLILQLGSRIQSKEEVKSKVADVTSHITYTLALS